MTTRRLVRRLLMFGLCFGVLTLGMARAAEADITVTNLSDADEGSLRWAIEQAAPGDTITFAVSGTIALTSGELVIGKSLTIVGPGPNLLTVSGERASRVFRIAPDVVAELQGLTVRNGNGVGGGDQPDGGGIYNDGTLTLLNLIVAGNTPRYQGGGVFSSASGSLTVRNSIFSDNRGSFGGAIRSGGSLLIIGSTLEGNTASLGGGGIFMQRGTSVIVGSTIAGNTVEQSGGGIDVAGDLTLVNCTISGNSAGYYGGGGFLHDGIVTLINTTVTGNTATRNGGGIYVAPDATEPVVLNNSIVAGNDADDISAAVVENNNSLIGGDVGLLPLTNNGGPTQTHALAANSPAVGGGDDALLPADTFDLDNDGNTTEPVPVDQRGVGFRRVSGGTVDIGAVEHQPDDDTDGVPNEVDNCPALANPDQRDTDRDAIGDACDVDDDNDGVPDILDWFPTDPSESEDTDRDGIGNNADVDDDGDGVADTADNCSLLANADQADNDRDGIGNVCDDTPGSPIEIVFVSTRDSAPRSLNLEIYGMRADGTDVVRLTTHPAIDLAPALSPDTSRIVFTSTRNNNRTEIFVMDADGANVRRLTTNSAIEGAAAWSPDGARIVFTSVRHGNADIYTMNADGSQLTRLTTHAKVDVNPAWGADGRIAFASNRHGNFDIYTMKPDGTDVRRLTTHKGDDALPTWSPDGTMLAFTSTRDGNAEIYVMNANGSSQTRRTNHRAIDAEPAWGADNRILFTSTRGGNTKIYAMNPDGSAITQLTNSPTGYDLSPHW